jgi:uroporphyrinogen III methyltransferase/synthase
MKHSALSTQRSALVSLVGAGPGDPKLLTLRGREVLEHADVVFYDALIGEAILRWARADAEQIFVGKRAGAHALSQDEINALIIEKAREGKTVCRLKGGDPFVFGRGGEEALACVQNQIPFEIVPGISSAIAAPAYAGIPVTHREVATSFAVVTGHTKTDDAPPENLPRADTLIFLMGVRALPKIVESLKEQGRAGSTPIALVRWGTTSQQQVVVGNLDTIVEDVARAALKPPALIVVGDVVNLRAELSWFDNPQQKPLLGKTIVVTRAREQASSLVEGLESLGANVLQCPTIRIEELSDTEYSQLDDAIANIADFDWVVFASRNGVEKFWKRLRFHQKDARALGNAKIAAIGPATTDALAAMGIVPDLVPESSISESVAADLLPFSPRNILLVRATQGRDVMQNVWRAAGAQVTLAPAYRTVPDHSDAEIVREKIGGGEVDWITFTSSSTVTNFVEAIGMEVLRAARASFRVACIGPITEKTARENDLAPDVVAPEASVESLVESLIFAV